jgi:hypothetical protein
MAGGREVEDGQAAVGQHKTGARIAVEASVIRAREHEAPAADLVGVFAGLLGHGVDQFEVTHDRASPWKGGNGTGKHRDTGRQRSEPEEGKHARRPEGPTGRGEGRDELLSEAYGPSSKVIGKPGGLCNALISAG